MPFDYKLLGYDDNFNHMLQSAETALDKLNAWYWVRDFNDPAGFADTSDPMTNALRDTMDYKGHSGSSAGRTLRSMQTIAKHGMRVFIEEVPHYPSYGAFLSKLFGVEEGHELKPNVPEFTEDNAWWIADEKRFRTLEEHIAYVSAR
jgi:hypothetical protein